MFDNVATKLLSPTKYIKTQSYRQFASADVLKDTTFILQNKFYVPLRKVPFQVIKTWFTNF